MKKFFVPIFLAAFAFTICSCSDAPVQSRFTENYAEKWFDYYGGNIIYDESQTLELMEFPNTVFHYDGLNVTAESERYEILMFSGMPIYNVYLSDLTGDGLPEFCSAVSIGFGIIDYRIIVYDYSSSTEYQLSDRFHSNYFLTLEDGLLTVHQIPIGEVEDVSGRLVLRDGELAME